MGIFIEILVEKEVRRPEVIPERTMEVQLDGIRLELRGTPVLRSWRGHLDSHIVSSSPVLANKIMKGIRIWRKKKKRTCFKVTG